MKRTVLAIALLWIAPIVLAAKKPADGKKPDPAEDIAQYRANAGHFIQRCIDPAVAQRSRIDVRQHDVGPYSLLQERLGNLQSPGAASAADIDHAAGASR